MKAVFGADIPIPDRQSSPIPYQKTLNQRYAMTYRRKTR